LEEVLSFDLLVLRFDEVDWLFQFFVYLKDLERWN